MDTKKLRQKILDLAIHGKLVPQDPNDEPASVLLERIRKEKEQLIKEGKIKKSKKSTKTSDTPHYENVPFEVPRGWVWCKIDDIAFVTKLAGFEYTNYIVGELEKGGSIPLFKGKNIKDGHIVYSFESYITKEISDLLYRSQISRKCLLTPYVGTIGNIAIHDKEGVFHLGSNVGKIELFNSQSHGVLEEYVLAFLRSSCGYKELVKHRKATAQESISIEAIRDVCVPFPPINEQQKIVAEIERWFALVDIIEQGKDTLQAAIAQAKSKILDLAIHGKLVPQDPSDEPAIELLRRINPRFTPCDNAHYPQLPQGWCICRLSDVVRICDNLRKPINSAERSERIANKTMTELYPYYGATGMVGYIDEYLIDGDYILLGEDGAPFLDKYASKAYIVKGKSWVNNHAHILQPLSNFEYMCYYLNAIKYDDYVNGSTRLKLTQADMKNICVALPPMDEQSRIVSVIRNTFEQLNGMMESL